jgi:hypothetical protein
VDSVDPDPQHWYTVHKVMIILAGSSGHFLKRFVRYKFHLFKRDLVRKKIMYVSVKLTSH